MGRLPFLFGALLLIVAPPLGAQGSEPEEKAVLEVVGRLFDGMREADSAKVRSVFLGDARLITAGERNGMPLVQIQGIDGFIQTIAASRERWDERLHGTEVRIDGNLAQVWTSYTFHRDEIFSHCGVNSLQLTRTPDGWKIVSLVDTRRRQGCDEPGPS